MHFFITKWWGYDGIFPNSYTLDIAVTPRGTVFLEVYNFVSCGTELPKMYANGIEYELNYGGWLYD